MNTWMIEEIVAKECERYELEETGFVTDRRAVVKALAAHQYAAIPEGCSKEDASPDEFAGWKERLLNDWYTRDEFACFFRRKSEKRCVYGMVKRLMLNTVSRLRRKHTMSTLDDELKVEGGRTVAFKLSSSFFSGLYSEVCCKGALFVSPSQLEEACNKRVQALFPLEYPLLYDRLLVKDNEFWEELWLLIRRFVRFLVTEYKGKEEEEVIKEVCMEAALSIQEQLERGKLKQIASASHLLNSLQMTCRNKLRESLRAEEKKKEEALLEEEDWLLLEHQQASISERDSMDGRFAYLLEVNEKSEYDVCCALADVLSYGRGKVYEALVEGMQEMVEAMSLLYVENKRYEEIAQILYGECSGKQLTGLRKSVSRGKEYLKKRMIGLIVTYKRRGELPFVAEEFAGEEFVIEKEEQ